MTGPVAKGNRRADLRKFAGVIRSDEGAYWLIRFGDRTLVMRKALVIVIDKPAPFGARPDERHCSVTMPDRLAREHQLGRPP
ncbi:MAG TPA: hypothetical protein VGO34_14825 [Alphaproteobacteria bacterium]|jgi:hypothetical protein